LESPADLAYASVFAVGLYETGTTELLRRIFRPGDVFLDIGANIGWYALHFARFVPQGQCHAFEPMPAALCKLKRNIALNRVEERVTVHPVALGSHHDRSTLYTFDRLPHLHSSFSTLNRDDAEGEDVAITTLDELFETGVIRQADVIKVDVEGFELAVRGGARRILGDAPPIWILEMNDETSRAFGYSPPDLLGRLCQYADYRFVRVPSAWERPQHMSSPEEYRHADNVICYVEDVHWERIQSVSDHVT